MKRRIVVLVCLMMAFQGMGKAKTDTLYYDKDWKGVNNRVFAAYFRVVEKTNDTITRKPFRDYYITGELQSEGYYIVLDKSDDNKSIMDGEFINYYKSGKIEQKGRCVHGKQEGEYVRYTEDGLISLHAYLKNDKFHGIYTEFEGDKCLQMEFKDGQPLHDYYILSNKDGLWSKINLKTGKPIYESPKVKEQLEEYRDGDTWDYYNKNGIIVAVTPVRVRDYGQYSKLSIVIANNSMFPIDFDPKEITAQLCSENYQFRELKVYSAEEYMRKVRRRQNFEMAMMAFGEAAAASNAGYSSSTTRTSYNGQSYSQGSASAYGNKGYAYGSYSGSTLSSGQSTSTTTSYNGAAAYQARVIASNRIASYENALLKERAVKNEGYLKKTTIYPGQTISGYIHIAWKRDWAMLVDIKIHGAVYGFMWGMSK